MQNCIVSKIGEDFNRLYGVMLRERLSVFNSENILFIKRRDVSIIMTTFSEFSIKNEIGVLKKIYEFLIRYID